MYKNFTYLFIKLIKNLSLCYAMKRDECRAKWQSDGDKVITLFSIAYKLINESQSTFLSINFCSFSSLFSRIDAWSTILILYETNKEIKIID